MNAKFVTRKETNKLLEWNTAIPRTGMKVKSTPFLAYNRSWYLVFDAIIEGFEEVWIITLCMDAGQEMNQTRSFPVITSIRHKGRDIFLSSREMNFKTTEIWRCYCFNFKTRYPTIEFNGTCLQFLFDLHLRAPGPGIFLTEEKSIQTSYSYADTKYPESHPCLENLSLDLSKLIEGGTDTDVLLKCGDFSIGAHKMILSARSEVFRTMMQSDMVEGLEGIVEIRDMEPQILKIFIQYIYTGILPELTMESALPIYEAADKYQVEALKKRSGHLLVKNLSPENALAILVAADAHSDTNLKDQLVSYISEEKIPNRKGEWLKFCNEYPKLGTEVLNFMFFK